MIQIKITRPDQEESIVRLRQTLNCTLSEVFTASLTVLELLLEAKSNRQTVVFRLPDGTEEPFDVVELLEEYNRSHR